ncbi:hypothetical protein ACS0TY_018281 [Phlomoides rotata]
MALDEKQNEVITSASNELAQRKADFEVNLNLLNELKVIHVGILLLFCLIVSYGFCIN